MNAHDITRQPFSALEGVIFLGAAAVAGVSFVPPAGVWQFSSSVAGWVFPVLVVLALVSVAGLRRGWLPGDRGAAPTSAPSTPRPPARWGVALTGLVTFSLAFAVLWALRCERFYGDAGAVTGFVKNGVLFHKREPLSPTVFLLAQRAVGDALGWGPMHTIRVVNTLVGALGVVALIGLARRIAGPSTGPRLAATAALLGCGAIQLFAGYIENYTLPTVCMLGSLVYALDALDAPDGRSGRPGLSTAFGLWTLACMFHLSGIVFLPAMLWLLWHARGPRSRALATALRLSAVTLLPAGVLLGLMLHFGYHRAEESGFGGGDGRMFVPLVAREGMSQYLFLRPQHLLALANQQLLVAPLGIVLLAAGTVGALFRGRWRLWRDAPPTSGLGLSALFFLGLVATGFLTLTVIWNPDLGALRDWDLFGPVGFYLNLGGVALLARHFATEPRRLTMLLALVAVVNLSRALPFLLHNAGL